MNWAATLGFLAMGAGTLAFAGLMIYLQNRFAAPTWVWVAGSWVIAALMIGALA